MNAEAREYDVTFQSGARFFFFFFFCFSVFGLFFFVISFLVLRNFIPFSVQHYVRLHKHLGSLFHVTSFRSQSLAIAIRRVKIKLILILFYGYVGT